MSDISETLKLNADEKYKKFSEKLIPDTKYPILGVRIPVIKDMAKSLSIADALAFTRTPHVFYEEYMLHGLLINRLNAENAFPALENFLPFIDNWAICDSVATSLKKLAKDKETLLLRIEKWLRSDKTYTVRFAIVLLLAHFITDEYAERANQLVLSVRSDEYYINMAISWYLSFALIKQYDVTVKILERRSLPKFIQNKTVSKARESFRLSQDKKDYLKTLTIK